MMPLFHLEGLAFELHSWCSTRPPVFLLSACSLAGRLEDLSVQVVSVRPRSDIAESGALPAWWLGSGYIGLIKELDPVSRGMTTILLDDPSCLPL